MKPEAVLKYAHVPVAMLGGLGEVLRRAWSEREDEPRPPVFIIVCNDTALAKVVYRWLAEDEVPVGIPPARLDGLHNTDGDIRTIRVDSKAVRESDDGGAKSDADRWMRLTLDTVGKTDWPWDTQGRPIYLEGFEALAKKLERPLHPPGRDVRCIVSVGMLAEGWDCNTVTHIVGLRPFMSQLLCEQVVGRGLRRSSYAVGDDRKLGEEVAKIFGVPFEVVPLKENPAGNESRPPPKIWPIHALPERAELEIRFPRVERYMQRIRHRLKVDWDNIAPLCLDPMDIPLEVEMKAGLPSNTGRPALVGPGRIERVDLNPYREGRRLQKLVFEMARDLTRDYRQQPHCDAPAHVLFPQIGAIVGRYLKEKVHALRPCPLRRRVARVLDPAARGARRPACPRRLAGGVEYRDGVLPVGAAPRLTSFLPYSHRCRLQTAPSRPPNVRARTDHVSDNNPVTDHTNTPPSTLIGPLFHLSVRVTAFLGHLEQERGCSVQTRNLRLTALRSFARYVAVRDAALVEWAGRIRAIPLKKTVRPRITWLPTENMDAMIAGPDRRAVAGRVEHALLLFLHNTGARASEAAGLQVEDLNLPERTGENARATIHGKGGKIRITPLWTSTAKALTALSRDRPPGCESVFWSRHRKPYTRHGIIELVERAAARVPELKGQKITPHVLRHYIDSMTMSCNPARFWLYRQVSAAMAT